MRKILSITLALLSITYILCAQENEAEIQYVLHEISFDIEGMTSETLLMRNVDLEVGATFASEEDLQAYLDRKRQEMVNLRVFDVVEVDYRLISQSNGQKLYEATYTIEDSLTFIPIIYPKYDSNTGFRLGSQLHYDNAFGTLTDWFLGANFDFGTKEYRINPKVSGLDIWGLTFSFSYSQSYDVSEKSSGGTTVAKWSFHQSSFGFGSSVNLVGPLKYGFGPSFSFRYAYKDVLDAGGFTKDFFDFTWQHNLRISEIDWIENYRDGYSVQLRHSVAAVNREQGYEPVNKLAIGGSYYKRFNRIMNFYTRADYSIVFNDEMTGFAENLRGVEDSELYGVHGAYINATMAFQFWRWVGVWDAQVHPFFDIGLADSMDASFHIDKNMKMGIGVDLVLYIDVLKNLVARGTIGYDLTSNLPKTDPERIEIIITSELHY